MEFHFFFHSECFLGIIKYKNNITYLDLLRFKFTSILYYIRIIVQNRHVKNIF